MLNHSYENEFILYVNKFSYERWVPGLALRKRLEVIQNWPNVQEKV